MNSLTALTLTLTFNHHFVTSGVFEIFSESELVRMYCLDCKAYNKIHMSLKASSVLSVSLFLKPKVKAAFNSFSLVSIMPIILICHRHFRNVVDSTLS